MLVCNGQTPCPTLYAEEGDIVQLHVQNDLYAQSSIHWYGFDFVVPFLMLIVPTPAYTNLSAQVWYGIRASIHKVRKTVRAHTKQLTILSL